MSVAAITVAMMFGAGSIVMLIIATMIAGQAAYKYPDSLKGDRQFYWRSITAGLFFAVAIAEAITGCFMLVWL